MADHLEEPAFERRQRLQLLPQVSSRSRPCQKILISSSVGQHAAAAKLATHFGVVRQHIDQLAQQGVIERNADGLFDQDQARVRYLNYLRTDRKTSQRSAADAKHAEAKTMLLQIRIEEKQRTLMPRDVHENMIEQMAGLVLTKLGGWPARNAGADLVLRRKAEAVLRELRFEIAEAATKLADDAIEPLE